MRPDRRRSSGLVTVQNPIMLLARESFALDCMGIDAIRAAISAGVRLVGFGDDA